jgi:DNA-binding HxlR family transcriptional regulator
MNVGLCPIGRTVERIGDAWSLMILRDAFHGLTRFDEFRKSLGVAPNVLTQRLAKLVAAGLLERIRYSERPPRYEYVLSEMGRDFWPVLIAMMEFGNRHFAKEGLANRLVDADTGQMARPVITDAESGRPLDIRAYKFAAGPAASPGMQKRMALAGERHASVSGRPSRRP